MRKAIVSALLGGAMSLMQLSTAAAGIEPVPFYTAFPDIGLLRPRILQIAVVYPQVSGFPAIAARIDARVLTIHDPLARPSWVTETLAIQGLGVIDHISRVLTSAVPPEADAGRMLLVADRISAVLSDPAFVPPPFAPQLVRALGHAGPGLGWDDDAPIQLLRPSAAAFDILMRISAMLFAPQPEPPKVASDGIEVLDRISAVLFAPQPEPPRVVSQAFDAMDRVSSVLGAAQVGTPDVGARSLDVMDRISAVLFAPQPEPPRVLFDAFDVMDRVSAVLFAPQPEPPKEAQVQALNIMQRIAAVLFAPQPEPPKQPYVDLTAFGSDAIAVVYNISGVTAWVAENGLAEGTIPGITALSQLSKHLTAPLADADPSRATAQLGAMLTISQQYVGY